MSFNGSPFAGGGGSGGGDEENEEEERERFRRRDRREAPDPNRAFDEEVQKAPAEPRDGVDEAEDPSDAATDFADRMDDSGSVESAPRDPFDQGGPRGRPRSSGGSGGPMGGTPDDIDPVPDDSNGRGGGGPMGGGLPTDPFDEPIPEDTNTGGGPSGSPPEQPPKDPTPPEPDLKEPQPEEQEERTGLKNSNESDDEVDFTVNTGDIRNRGPLQNYFRERGAADLGLQESQVDVELRDGSVFVTPNSRGREVLEARRSGPLDELPTFTTEIPTMEQGLETSGGELGKLARKVEADLFQQTGIGKKFITVSREDDNLVAEIDDIGLEFYTEEYVASQNEGFDKYAYDVTIGEGGEFEIEFTESGRNQLKDLAADDTGVDAEYFSVRETDEGFEAFVSDESRVEFTEDLTSEISQLTEKTPDLEVSQTDDGFGIVFSGPGARRTPSPETVEDVSDFLESTTAGLPEEPGASFGGRVPGPLDEDPVQRQGGFREFQREDIADRVAENTGNAVDADDVTIVEDGENFAARLSPEAGVTQTAQQTGVARLQEEVIAERIASSTPYDETEITARVTGAGDVETGLTLGGQAAAIERQVLRERGEGAPAASIDVQATPDGFSVEVDEAEQFGDAQIGIPGTDTTLEEVNEDLARGYDETITETAGDVAAGIAGFQFDVDIGDDELSTRREQQADIAASRRATAAESFTEGVVGVTNVFGIGAGLDEIGETIGYVAGETVQGRGGKAVDELTAEGTGVAEGALEFTLENPIEAAGTGAGILVGGAGASRVLSRAGSLSGRTGGLASSERASATIARTQQVGRPAGVVDDSISGGIDAGVIRSAGIAGVASGSELAVSEDFIIKEELPAARGRPESELVVSEDTGIVQREIETSEGIVPTVDEIGIPDDFDKTSVEITEEGNIRIPAEATLVSRQKRNVTDEEEEEDEDDEEEEEEEAVGAFEIPEEFIPDETVTIGNVEDDAGTDTDEFVDTTEETNEQLDDILSNLLRRDPRNRNVSGEIVISDEIVPREQRQGEFFGDFDDARGRTDDVAGEIDAVFEGDSVFETGGIIGGRSDEFEDFAIPRPIDTDADLDADIVGEFDLDAQGTGVLTGDVAEDLAGDLAGDLTGDLAGDLAGDAVGDLSDVAVDADVTTQVDNLFQTDTFLDDATTTATTTVTTEQTTTQRTPIPTTPTPGRRKRFDLDFDLDFEEESESLLSGFEGIGSAEFENPVGDPIDFVLGDLD